LFSKVKITRLKHSEIDMAIIFALNIAKTTAKSVASTIDVSDTDTAIWKIVRSLRD